MHYPTDIIAQCVRWYLAYALSLRNLEEMMAERGIAVDHSTLHRWVIRLAPLLDKAFRRQKLIPGITSIGIEITEMKGKLKLGQHRSQAEKLSVFRKLEQNDQPGYVHFAREWLSRFRPFILGNNATP